MSGKRIIKELQVIEYPELRIFVHVPACYKPETPSGLFFFMHGGDSTSPPTQPFDIYLNEKTGTLYPFIENIPFITVAPEAPHEPDGKRWNCHGVCEYIEAVIKTVCAEFNIDKDRMILGGHSMGGFGAYHAGSLLADRFAGIWMSAGAWQMEDFRTFEGTPIYIQHGKYDCAADYREARSEPRHHSWCGISFARAAHELLDKYHIEHVYDEHDGGHSLKWESAKMALRRFFAWAQKLEKRNPYPNKCVLTTPRGACDPILEEHHKTRYLVIEKIIEDAEIEIDKIVQTGPDIAWTRDEFNAQNYRIEHRKIKGARITAENCGNNKFVIQTENVEAFSIYLNREMVDFSRPCEIIVNGKRRVFNTYSKLIGNDDYTASLFVG